MLAQLKTRFRNWLLKTRNLSLPSEGIHQLAFRHGLDRRRHPRVSFPKNFPFFSQPFFEFQGIKFEVVDLSQGGVCLFDPKDDFTMPVGSTNEMCWVSRDLKEKVKFQLVGMSYQKKHLEFKEASHELVQEISQFLEAGICGQKMRRSMLSTHAHIETSILELWIGVGGANLSFQSDPHFVASLDGPEFCVNFYKGSLPVYRFQDERKGRVLPLEERIKLLFFISNFPVLSSRIQNLLEDWARAEAQALERAG